ncbi:MAG: Gfo/Idh/MocA family oxidoreductase [Chloroflexi bacterium]|nr:Gfo/Idh/MocA family oxidoreductase [Chloroflexota bacterium]
MPQPLTAVLIGAGQRGYEAYGPYALAHPDEIRFVAVAEPHDVRRARFAKAHGIPPEQQFRSWEELFALGKIADAALICTLDRQHVEPTIAALENGYDVLLEKPMATTLADCVRLVQTAERTGRLLQICHELRYTPFFSILHDLVTSGRLGRIITVEHRENVSYWHMAHSYVRGNWRNSHIESPMILAKCCHDLDILFWNLGPCRRLGSFGSLIHYRPENAPPGAPERCTDGCPAADECPWYAPRLYLELVPLLHVARRSPVLWERLGATFVLRYPRLAELAKRRIPGLATVLDYRGWPLSVISEDTSPEARLRALETGPYGRCVYYCDNDVVDHQIVNMEMENGTSVALVMHGHSHQEGRTMRYDGTRATLFGYYYLTEHEIQIHDHMTGKVEIIRPPVGPLGGTGHAGADAKLMAAFVRAVRDPSYALTTARESLESHLMAFAAEEARVNGTVVSMDDFRQRAESIQQRQPL